MPTPCDTCAAHCCRGTLVPLTAHDLARLVRVLVVPPGDVAQLSYHDGEHRFRVRLEPAPAPFRRLELRHQDQNCTFLLELGGIGRCGVYADRPLLCRTFPVEPDGETLVPLATLCGPGAWDASPPDPDAHRALHRQRYAEEACMEELVRSWNARVEAVGARSEEQFYDYLIHGADAAWG